MKDDDFNSIFESSEADEANENIVEETEELEAANAVEETPEPDADETGEPPVQTAPAVEEEKHPHHVPVTALLDERDKRKEAQKEADELRRQIAEYQASQTQRVETPDPYVDPEAYNAFLQNEIQRQVNTVRMEMSLDRAKEKEGEEAVNAAIQWAREKANSDPSFDAQIAHQTSPIEWAVRQHKRHTELSEYESDPEGFVLRKAAEIQARNSTAASTVIPTATAANITDGVKNKAPKSLASAPAANKQEKPLNDDDDFNSIFRK